MSERKIICSVCGKEVCVKSTKEGDFIRVHKAPETEGDWDRTWCEGSDEKVA